MGRAKLETRGGIYTIRFSANGHTSYAKLKVTLKTEKSALMTKKPETKALKSSSIDRRARRAMFDRLKKMKMRPNMDA